MVKKIKNKNVLLNIWFICKFGSKEFAQKKGDAVHSEATHVCYVEDAREVTHVILMLLEEKG